MNNLQTYQTRRLAIIARDNLAGWPRAKVVRHSLPDDPNAGRGGNVWALECAPGRYMREDGYVR